MRKAVCAVMLAVQLVLMALIAFAGSAAANGETFTLQCGTKTFTTVKPSESAAVYTNGTMEFVTAIGAFMTGGTAQPNAVLCTINGFGPVPFIITPSH